MAVLNVTQAGRGVHVLRALDLVFEALDVAVTHYARPVNQSDRDPQGEITDDRIAGQLRAIVLEHATRTTTALDPAQLLHVDGLS